MVQPGTVVADTGFAEVREAGRQNPQAAGRRRVGAGLFICRCISVNTEMTEYMKTKDKITNLERRNPVGVGNHFVRQPRVASRVAGQPWAEGRNPFGIGPDGALALCESKRLTGWVLYDGECGLCTGWARRFGAVLNRRRFELAPLQTPWVRERLGLVPGVVLTEMRLLLSDGSIYGGADAIIEIARR